MIKANAYSILGAILIILLISCKEQEGNLGDFKILPSPQQFDISGISNLSASSVQTYFDQGKIGLPVLGENLKKITSEGNEKNAQIIFNIDSVKNERVEGYRMVISKNQIEISARDKAGLLYGFMTLEQLLEDAKDQNVNLPTCSIIDYPLLSYRAIHVDVKHHTEKKEYYFPTYGSTGQV